MKLEAGERIICAFADNANGPNWCNQIVTVIIRKSNGVIRMDSLQPDEQSPEIKAMFDICSAVHISLCKQVFKIYRYNPDKQ